MNRNIEPHHLARVIFRDQILHKLAVGREETPEFKNYVQIMFRPIIRTDKAFVNDNIQFWSLCVRFFPAFFVTDRCVMARFPSIGESHVLM